MYARVAICVSVAAIALGAPGPALADDAKTLATQAVELAKQGRQSGDQAKFSQAIVLFKQAFALDPRPEYQCGIGIAYYDRQELSRAHLFVGRCIARTSSAERKQQLRKLHQSLEKTMREKGFAAVDIVSRPARATVHVSYFADDERVPAPLQVWLPTGDYKIEAEAPGRKPATKAFQVSASQRVVRVVVELEPAPKPVVKSETRAPIATPTPQPQPGYKPLPPSKLPVYLYSAAGAAVVVGAVFHGVAYNNILSIRGQTASTVRSDTIGEIKTQRAVAVGMYAVGAMSVAAGLYLRQRDRAASRSTVELALLPTERADGAILSVGWRR